MDTLTEKQRAFVREYIKDYNASAAYIRAGYSRKASRTGSSLLMANQNIQTAIKQHTDTVTSAAIMEYAEACEILTSMARGHIGHYLDDNAQIDINRIRTVYPQAVQSIDQTTTYAEDGTRSCTTKFRLHDRVRAIERLSKLRGWDRPEQLEIDTTVTQFILPEGVDPEGTEFASG